MTTIQTYWKAFLTLIYKNECLVCRTELTLEEEHVCLGCLKKIIPVQKPNCFQCGLPLKKDLCYHCKNEKPFFDQTHSLFTLNTTTRKIIHQIKYYQKDWLLKLFETHLKKAPLEREIHCDSIIPVPLSWRREFERGFNQAYLIAQMLQKVLRKPIHRKTIKKRHTLPQAFLKRKDRLTNPQGTFMMANPKSIRGKDLLLVDDVMTTGTTVNECARILKKAGAKSVSVFTLIRTTHY